MNLLNLRALEAASVHQEPYPYAIFEHFLNPEYQEALWQSFPNIPGRGSYSLPMLKLEDGPFAQLMEELKQPALRELIAKKLNLNLSDHPPLITLRAHSTERDGLIHKDSVSKIVTVLIYLNPEWASETGKLRILYDKDHLAPYAAEISPLFGNCLIFKVTPNCWHGYAPYVGVRRSIQLNYVASDRVATIQGWRHRLSAFIKKILGKHARPSY